MYLRVHGRRAPAIGWTVAASTARSRTPTPSRADRPDSRPRRTAGRAARETGSGTHGVVPVTRITVRFRTGPRSLRPRCAPGRMAGRTIFGPCPPAPARELLQPPRHRRHGRGQPRLRLGHWGAHPARPASAPQGVETTCALRRIIPAPAAGGRRHLNDGRCINGFVDIGYTMRPDTRNRCTSGCRQQPGASNCRHSRPSAYAA